MRVRDRHAWNWLSRYDNFFETSDRREAHDKCCDVQNNERTFMNCLQISKKAQRNWSTAGKQAFALKYEQIGNWFVTCAEFGRNATEKSAGKKATDSTNTRHKAEENEKTELTGLKLIDLSGWNSLFLNIIQGCEWLYEADFFNSKRLLKIFLIFNVT